MSQQLLVVFHGNCDDGFGAAWAIHQAELAGQLKTFWPAGVEYVKGVYGFPPPDCHGRDLVLVDFCYPADVMEELVAVAKTVLVLDHHVSAQKDMVALAEKRGWAVLAETNYDGGPTTTIRGGNNTVVLEFDMNRSGTVMAWEHFMGHTHLPTLVKYIQDRDLWTKKLPYIDEFTMALRSWSMDFPTWDKIYRQVEPGAISNPGGFAEFVQHGLSILRYQKQLVDQAVKNSFWVMLTAPEPVAGVSLANEAGDSVPFGAIHYRWKIRAACVPGALASEVGEALAEKFGGIGLTWSEGKDFLNYSLRSRGDKAPDVSMIAKAFGGGGHAKASGFKSSVPVHVKEVKA